MIVPDHWAEARKQDRSSGRQVTVRRYGWSTVSEADALAMAETRADEALRRILTGERVNRREPKVAYNGASGVPIREEVLARHGEEVITRNAYGAHCLNTPNALFADIDFAQPNSAKAALIAFAILAVISAMVGASLKSWSVTLAMLVVSLIAAGLLSALVVRLTVVARGGPDRIARKRLDDFLSRNPTWNLRLYRTPAGYRVLATHQPFEATQTEVQTFFAAVSTDPVYVRMCINQRCFRARLTAKPWRIGISAHMRPRPGVWPVCAERMALRNEWIAGYEARAAPFAACRFVDSIGSGVVHESLKAVIELHDHESRAHVADAMLA
jgi:hypothetical protein